MILLPFYVDDIIKTALTEDINYIDSTLTCLSRRTAFHRRISCPRRTAFCADSK